MTALACLWTRDGEPTDRRCAAMLEAQAIYGPDGAAQRSAGPVTLGRRMFCVTDEDARDRGPVTGAGGALTLVADARIDNRADLASRLGLDPALLRVASEAELLLHVVERWGVSGLAHIVGAFALIWWDAREQTLFLARDALGERPLHYHVGTGLVAAASMPKGLHALGDVPYAANADASLDFLALLPETEPASFFSAIDRVLPGHVVRIDSRGVRNERFWQWANRRPAAAKAADYPAMLRDALDRAVQRRLRRAHGGVGAHLSGGLDSACVAASAAMAMAPAPLVAFTAVPTHAVEVPPGMIGDEGPLAAATAALHPNIDHVTVRSGDRSPLSLLDRHFHLFERPVLNPSNAVWSEAIADAARQRGVTVLLTGQMGNLTISHAGMEHLAQLLGGGRLAALARLWWGLGRQGVRQRTIAAAALGPYLPRGWWRWIAARLAGGLPLGVYTALRMEASWGIESRAGRRGLDLAHQPWRDSVALRIWALDRVDMGVYNKGMLGGWGIDMRDPTADRDLVELCLAIPDAQFIRGGVPRSLGRRAFADRLPDVVLRERRRGFQAADWHVALGADRRGLAMEIDAIERCAVADTLIDAERLRRSVDTWPDGGWHRRDRIARYELALLRGVAAGHFLRRVARTN